MSSPSPSLTQPMNLGQSNRSPGSLWSLPSKSAAVMSAWPVTPPVERRPSCNARTAAPSRCTIGIAPSWHSCRTIAAPIRWVASGTRFSRPHNSTCQPRALAHPYAAHAARSNDSDPRAPCSSTYTWQLVQCDDASVRVAAYRASAAAVAVLLVQCTTTSFGGWASADPTAAVRGGAAYGMPGIVFTPPPLGRVVFDDEPEFVVRGPGLRAAVRDDAGAGVRHDARRPNETDGADAGLGPAVVDVAAADRVADGVRRRGDRRREDPEAGTVVAHRARADRPGGCEARPPGRDHAVEVVGRGHVAGRQGERHGRLRIPPCQSWTSPPTGCATPPVTPLTFLVKVSCWTSPSRLTIVERLTADAPPDTVTVPAATSVAVVWIW